MQSDVQGIPHGPFILALCKGIGRLSSVDPALVLNSALQSIGSEATIEGLTERQRARRVSKLAKSIGIDPEETVRAGLDRLLTLVTDVHDVMHFADLVPALATEAGSNVAEQDAVLALAGRIMVGRKAERGG